MKKLLPLAALLLMAALAFAQVNLTALSGIVTDQTGAAVPGVTVEVVNPAIGQKISVTTSERGEYAVPSLSAATYQVTFTKSGFKTLTQQNVILAVGVPGTLNVKMEVGAAAESVEVTAGADVVQATTADVSSNLTGKQLTDLPFATRNAIELTVDLPGTATPTNPRSSSIDGLPKGAINVTIDGMNTQDNMLKSSDGFFSYIMPSVDSLEEVTMETAAAGVDSTAQGGAQIKFVTRSGTNNWHGGGFWQVRNTFFDANAYFNNLDHLPRAVIKLNQEGGHIGGPILKNKLFFFGNMEVYRYPGTNTYSRSYLNPTASSGIYTYATTSGQINQINVLALAAQANASLPAGSIPYPTTADPILAKTYTGIQQAASTSGLGGSGVITNNNANNDYNTNTVNYQPGGIDARDFFTSRIDYIVNSKNTLSFIYNYDWYNAVPDLLNGLVPVYPGTGDVLFSTTATGQGSNRFDGTISLRSTLTPRMTNEWRMGLNGGTVTFFVGISPGLFAPWRGYDPSFASAGTGLSGVATPDAQEPQRRNAPVKNLGDTVTWVKGAHTFSFGGNWDQINLYQQIEYTSIFPSISFGIATSDPITTGSTNIFTATNLPGASSAQLADAANLYADVVGRVTGISTQVTLSEQNHQYSLGQAPIDRDQMREYGFFAQDSWRVLPSLTASIGLRVEKQGAFENLDHLYSSVSYADIWGISGVGNLFSPGANSGQAPVYSQLTSNGYSPAPVFAPSVGLAWQAPGSEGFLGTLFGHRSGQTVLRGGYSISTVREGMDVYYGVYGSNQGITIDDSVNPGTYPQYFGAPGSVEFSQATLPTRPYPTTPSYPIADTANSMYAIDPNLRMGYVQSWNFSLQRELDRNTVVDFRFVGNHGTDLWRLMSINETNIFGNSQTGTFFSQFLAAQNNLAIARGGNINNPSTAATSALYNNWGNSGLAGQVNVPMLTTAVGTSNDSTTATDLQLNEAGTFANAIAGNSTRMANLIAAGYPSNQFQVNPLLGASANILTNNGSSYFDAFQVEVRRRLSKGLLINASYQYGKSLAEGGTASGTDSSTPTSLRNYGLDKIPSGFDIRNQIKMNFLYELPFGPGRAFAANGSPIVKKILEGWEISGVMRLQSGTPLSLSGFDTFNNHGDGVILHNITISQLQSEVGIYKTPYLSSGGYGTVWYLPPPPAQTVSSTGSVSYVAGLNSTNNTNLITNTMAAFNAGGLTPYQVDPNAPYLSPAAPGQMGWNGYLYLPWQRHFDLSLQKNTRIGEHVNMTIACHALDVFNITNFLPGGGNTSSTFGTVTTAYADISGSVDPGARIFEFVVRLSF